METAAGFYKIAQEMKYCDSLPSSHFFLHAFLIMVIFFSYFILKKEESRILPGKKRKEKPKTTQDSQKSYSLQHFQ